MTYSLSDILPALDAHADAAIALRRDLHTHPELAYAERHTADLVARELASYGIEVHRGLAQTGVVGVLRAGSSGRTVGLRADMDALPIGEQNDLPYRSTVSGAMHACGHDGHTAMLLLAARHLSATCRFDGTAVFIFQPAEERGGGARTMVQEGLFERFPVDAIYAMHNIPGIEAGHFAVMPGAMMAAGDYFEIALAAAGGHAALPHTTADPILAGSALVLALQSVVSRTLDPLEPAVVSVTQFHGGEASNAIPATVKLQGTARSYTPAVQNEIAASIARLTAGTAASYGVEANVLYQRGYPATINTPREAAFAYQVLEGLVGPERARADLKPLMTAEDFSFMLQARPGAYVWIGNGDTAGLHTPRYNFNDAILTTGAAFWVRLVEATLAAE